MIKQGYKQTELGLIPKDWEVKYLNELADIDVDNLPNSTDAEYTFNYISLEDVDYGVLKNISETTFKNAPSRARRKVKEGDVLISTVRPNLKSHLLIRQKVQNWICSTGFSVLSCKRGINSSFIYQNFFSPIINSQIENVITGSNYPAINSRDLKKLKIPLPSTIEEQTAIANALSDVDDLIDSLEKLIKKKKLIKQGALQKLLKPKEGWGEYTLGDICIIFKGSNLSKSKLSNGGRFKCILYGELFTHYNEAINNVDSFTNYDEGISSKTGDILFPGSTTTKGVDLAKACTLLLDNIRLGGDIIILRKKNYEYNSIFLTYYLNQEKKLEIGNLAKGITIYHLYGSDLKGIKVHFPSLDEQEEIADILSDMDNEIAQLEAKLNKYKQVKLGMMQNLLTGKIRLVQQIESIKPVEQSKSTPFDEATLIATFVNRYAKKQNPITRFRYTKLLYLFHRYVDNNIDGFLKKAAGPYNPSNRYKGPEGILIKNKYAKIYGDKFYPDTNINEVEKYYKKKHSLDALVWLDEFSKYQDEHLELLATVDMAIVDLRNEAKEINVQNVKDVIKKNPEWEPKLQRPIFSDSNIQRAIKKSIELFG